MVSFSRSDSLIDKLCKINGIENANKFLHPTGDQLHDPYSLTNIEDAANTILSAINNGKRIAVSVDPDSDGLSSAAIMYRFLSNFTDNVYLIYAQRSDGHGIENQVQMIEDGTYLVIILDSSTNSIFTCEQLSSAGMKVVILDHHLAELKNGETYSNPHAIVVNPQLDSYRNKSISGAGVTYKTIKVIEDSTMTEYADQYLDLVATGLCADVMSMKEEENRALVYAGLKNVVNPGILAILKQASIDVKNVNSQTIGYTIGPMLNGAARMGDIKLAIDLLTEDDPKVCSQLAKRIKVLNDERKAIELEVFNRIKPKINENDKVIFVIDNEIDKSFNGLIANKIATAYMRPAVVVREDNGKLMGSFRSYGDMNLKWLLEQTFGDTVFTAGHTQAGGFGCPKSMLKKVISTLNETLKDMAFEITVEYDLELDQKDITEQMLLDIEQFSLVTGKDIPQPKFLIKNFFVSDVSVIGSNKNTVKISGGNLVAMKFRTSQEFADSIDIFQNYSLVGSLNLNRFFNWGKRQMVVTKQVFIDDIKEG